MSFRADVVIVGGSVVGCSVAWHLRDEGFRGRIVLVERDPTFRRASAYLAMGGIRQQFCTPVTVQMVRYSVDLLKEFDRRAAFAGLVSRAWFRQRGYLFLANTARSGVLMSRYQQEQQAGANVHLISREDIRKLMPDVAVDDIIYGLLGPEDGYADPRQLLFAFRRAADEAGADLIAAEVTRVRTERGRVQGVELANGDAIDSPVVVNAAGPWAGRLAETAGLPVPIQPVRQTLFRAALPRPWPYRFPMVIDPTGVHWRHDDPGTFSKEDRIIVAFTKWTEPPGENFEPASDRWPREFLPALVRRVPAFKDLRDADGWAGLYEMTPDHNPVFGEHPALGGFIFANGFSGHGLMMAPAAGKIVSEIIRLGRSTTFDVGVFAPDRFERGALVHDAATI